MFLINSWDISFLLNDEHSVKVVRIRSYSVRMRENPGKMQTRITPNTDFFYAVECAPDQSIYLYFNETSSPKNIANDMSEMEKMDRRYGVSDAFITSITCRRKKYLEEKVKRANLLLK